MTSWIRKPTQSKSTRPRRTDGTSTSSTTTSSFTSSSTNTTASSTGTTTCTPTTSTERTAQEAYESNRRLYSYPTTASFVHKIEGTSLLYTMMQHPKIYPSTVIYQMILDEDLMQYIYLQENEKDSTGKDKDQCKDSHRDAVPVAPSNDNISINSNNYTNHTTIPSYSYAQLTALLALAAEKWPPASSSSSTSSSTSSNTHSQQNNNTDDDRNSRYQDEDEDEYEQSKRNRAQQRQRQQQQQQSEHNRNHTNHNNNTTNADTLNIVQTLCQRIVQCIVKHCERYQLDRETEIQDLFKPFQTVTTAKNTRSSLLSIVPAYMGLTATILCGGNPIPFYIGYAISIHAVSQQEQNLQNYNSIAQTTSRMSHIETTNLLHDTDHNDDYYNE
jgi:hypothetical protein